MEWTFTFDESRVNQSIQIIPKSSEEGMLSWREDGEMGRWGDGEMGRWGDGDVYVDWLTNFLHYCSLWRGVQTTVEKHTK